MQLSVELTHYPFSEGYLTIIKSTVAKLSGYDGIHVTTFPTASILVGEYVRVFEVLQDVMAWSVEQHGRSVFIAKFLPDYVAD